MKKSLILTLLILVLTSCTSLSNASKLDTSTPDVPPPTLSTLTPSPTLKLRLTKKPTHTQIMPTIQTLTPSAGMKIVQAGEIPVPVLLYHHISAEIKGSPYSTDPAVFKKQMQWLFENHYKTITISDLAELINKGGTLPKKAVILTFDDGYLDVYKNAYPILEELGYVATFYVIGESIDELANMSSRQLKKLIKSGWEIGSHGLTHADLNKTEADLESEIIGSKKLIEDKLGIPVKSFAYPYGQAKPSVIAYTLDAGYSSAVGLGSSILHSPSSLYYLSRIEIENGLSLEQFINLFIAK